MREISKGNWELRKLKDGWNSKKPKWLIQKSWQGSYSQQRPPLQRSPVGGGQRKGLLARTTRSLMREVNRGVLRIKQAEDEEVEISGERTGHQTKEKWNCSLRNIGSRRMRWFLGSRRPAYSQKRREKKQWKKEKGRHWRKTLETRGMGQRWLAGSSLGRGLGSPLFLRKDRTENTEDEDGF